MVLSLCGRNARFVHDAHAEFSLPVFRLKLPVLYSFHFSKLPSLSFHLSSEEEETTSSSFRLCVARTKKQCDKSAQCASLFHAGVSDEHKRFENLKEAADNSSDFLVILCAFKTNISEKQIASNLACWKQKCEWTGSERERTRGSLAIPCKRHDKCLCRGRISLQNECRERNLFQYNACQSRMWTHIKTVVRRINDSEVPVAS